MNALKTMTENWWTTVLGVLLGVGFYVKDTCFKMPTTKQDWWTFGFSALLAGLGWVSKDALTGSRPGTKAILVLVTVLGLTACSTTNISELVKALAQDPATVCITATGYGGSVTVSRSNIFNGDVTCPPGGGLSVKSTGGTSIPVTVTTQPPPTTITVNPSPPAK